MSACNVAVTGSLQHLLLGWRPNTTFGVLQVLRFANLVFEPLWSRQYIRNVQVRVVEQVHIEARTNITCSVT